MTEDKKKEKKEKCLKLNESSGGAAICQIRSRFSETFEVSSDERLSWKLVSLSVAGPHRTVKCSLKFIVVRQHRKKSLPRNIVAL